MFKAALVLLALLASLSASLADSLSIGGALWSAASVIERTAVGGAFTGGSATVSVTYLLV